MLAWTGRERPLEDCFDGKGLKTSRSPHRGSWGHLTPGRLWGAEVLQDEPQSDPCDIKAVWGSPCPAVFPAAPTHPAPPPFAIPHRQHTRAPLPVLSTAEGPRAASMEAAQQLEPTRQEVLLQRAMRGCALLLFINKWLAEAWKARCPGASSAG